MRALACRPVFCVILHEYSRLKQICSGCMNEELNHVLDKCQSQDYTVTEWSVSSIVSDLLSSYKLLNQFVLEGWSILFSISLIWLKHRVYRVLIIDWKTFRCKYEILDYKYKNFTWLQMKMEIVRLKARQASSLVSFVLSHLPIMCCYFIC